MFLKNIIKKVFVLLFSFGFTSVIPSVPMEIVLTEYPNGVILIKKEGVDIAEKQLPFDEIAFPHTFKYYSAGNAEHDKIAEKIFNEMRATSPTKEIMASETTTKGETYIHYYFASKLAKYELDVQWTTMTFFNEAIVHFSVKSFEDRLNDLYSKYKNKSQTI
jgi:hypothetical protein